MKLKQILESNDSDHQDALDQTGFWGAQAAGAIILAASSGKLLISHRSSEVEQPHTWGVWGGAIDEGESPVGGATREVTEELGHITTIAKIPLYVFKDSNSDFRYYNFLFVVEKEFEPSPMPGSGWETQGHEWVTYGEWPTPMHFGLEALIKNSGSKIQSVIARYR